MSEKIVRRRFLTLAGAGSAMATAGFGCAAPTAAAPGASVAEPPPRASAAPESAPPAPVASSADPPLTLNATEYAFVEAAVDTLIPADDLSPSGSACGVATFIDRQLAGAFGSGARLYREGPFLRGKPEHGYQLALTPRGLFREGIAATNAWTRKAYGKSFDDLPPSARIDALKALEQGQPAFAGLSSGEFFEALLSLTMEGFFADPIYGGNRDKAAWKMVGYPGLPATYHLDVHQHRGKLLDRAPQSIADFA